MGFSRQETGVGCHFLLREFSQPRDRTQVSCTVGRHFTIWATREKYSIFKLHIINHLRIVHFIFCYLDLNFFKKKNAMVKKFEIFSYMVVYYSFE